MRFPGPTRRATGLIGVVLCTWWVASAPRAQYGPPPKASTHDLALTWLAGRWAQPVTCERADGSHFERERAISFRIDPSAGSGQTGLRATLYGIDAPDAVRCFNLLEHELDDVRGVIYLQVRGSNREDTGLVDFQRMLADGALDYFVSRGTLRRRAIGAGEAAWTRLKVPAGARLSVSSVERGSDDARLFAAHDLLPDPSRGARRLFRFELHDVPDLTLGLALLEEPSPSRR